MGVVLCSRQYFRKFSSLMSHVYIRNKRVRQILYDKPVYTIMTNHLSNQTDLHVFITSQPTLKHCNVTVESNMKLDDQLYFDTSSYAFRLTEASSTWEKSLRHRSGLLRAEGQSPFTSQWPNALLSCSSSPDSVDNRNSQHRQRLCSSSTISINKG